MDDLCCQTQTPIYQNSLNENKTESGYYGKPLIKKKINKKLFLQQIKNLIKKGV